MADRVDVLIVDDERINLKFLEGVLGPYDLNLIMAKSGEEALACLDDADLAVALLDIMMPGMDGYELAERIRAHEKCRNVPIIFITAINKEEQHIFRGYEVGAVDYIFKPVQPVILRSKVAVFVEMFRKNKRLQEATERLASTVAQLRASQEALQDSEKRYRTVADYTYDWESWVGPQGTPLYVSPACERITGYDQKKFFSDPGFLEHIIHRDDLPAWRQFMEDDSPVGELDFRIYHKNTRERRVTMVKRRVVDPEGEYLGIRTSVRDVTRRWEMQQRLKHEARHDTLTGLPNRSHFITTITRRIEEAGGTYMAVLLIDLDRFKVVNDSHGHEFGDKLLMAVANRLKSLVGGDGVVGRFGGDEFSVVLTGFTRKKDAIKRAKELRQAVDEPYIIEGETIEITVCLGLHVDKVRGCEPDECVRNAHIAVYKAKEDGRDRTEIFHPRIRNVADRALTIEKEMRRALGTDEFEVFYQPIVNIADSSLLGFEALARWRHPEWGLVSPGEFIPIAEETGLISELGSIILEKACRTTQGWRMEHDCSNHLTVSVNISSRQFGNPALIHNIEDTLMRTGLPPSQLKLEITETVVMDNAFSSVNKLKRLQQLGVSLSIDDFGTGYSSMSYLRLFPLDQLKIDLSFIQRLGQEPETMEIVRAIIDMAHGLRLKVVAEGIETNTQQSLLNTLRCDYGQGYLYSKPLPESEATSFISGNGSMVEP